MKVKNKIKSLEWLRKDIIGRNMLFETPFGKEWDLKEAKFNAGPVGQIDLLAQHREKPKWLVIELKKDTSPDNTIGQILRYMGWIKKNHAGNDEEVEGLIISGFPPDDWIRYALLVTPNVKQRIYYCSDNAVAKFIDENLVDTLLKFTKRTIDEQKIIWKRLEGQAKVLVDEDDLTTFKIDIFLFY